MSKYYPTPHHLTPLEDFLLAAVSADRKRPASLFADFRGPETSTRRGKKGTGPTSRARRSGRRLADTKSTAQRLVDTFTAAMKDLERSHGIAFSEDGLRDVNTHGSTNEQIARLAFRIGMLYEQWLDAARDQGALRREIRRRADTTGACGGRAARKAGDERTAETLRAFARWVAANPKKRIHEFIREFAETQKPQRGFTKRVIRKRMNDLELEVGDVANQKQFRNLDTRHKANAIATHLKGKPGITPATIRLLLSR